METTIYLIRHGRTPDEKTRKYHGHTDIPLSPRGLAQITGLAEWLKARVSSLEAIYCSDLERASRSAGIIASAFGLRPVEAPELRERHFGRWEGLTFEQIRRSHPEEFRTWLEGRAGFKPAGGESAEQVLARAMPFFRRIVRRHAGERTAVVAHGGVNRIILCTLLGISLEHLFRIEQDYGALTIVEYRGDVPVVKALNVTEDFFRSGEPDSPP